MEIHPRQISHALAFIVATSAFQALAPITPINADQPTAIPGDPANKQEPLQSTIRVSEVVIAAHRGGYETDKADNAPENSVANIRVCQTKGYEIYETDIQRTQDGHFVILHDATIDRETTGTGKASEMSFDEIKKLRKKFRDGTPSEHRVATLDEFLAEGHERVRFKADLKPGVNQYFSEIMERVTRQQASSTIIFRVPYRDADLFETYLRDGVPITGDMLMFMVSSKKQFDDIVKRFRPTMIQINLPKNEPTNPKTLDLIRYATSEGIQVETHAEGNPDNWRRLIQAGVRIFHTNKPAKMKRFLRETNGS